MSQLYHPKTGVRSLALLVSLLICGTLQADPPELRHLNYLALQASRGDEIQIEVRSIAHGIHASEERLRWRLLKPDGYTVATGEENVGTERSLRFPVDWEGKSAFEMKAGSNLSQLKFTHDTPHAYLSRVGSPLSTVRAWGPLYFFVPKGVRSFDLWLSASAPREGLHYTIRDPDGAVVREDDGDFDQRTKVQLLLPKEKNFDGRVWSLEISRPTNPGIYLDDVSVELGQTLAPYLAPKPEWAEAFGSNWKPDPALTSAKRTFEPTKPEVEPFHGLFTEEIKAAYDRDVSTGWKTTLPFTYVLDYGPQHVSNPEQILTIDDPKKGPQIQGDPNYVTTVGTAPPTLLHLGKDVALNHGWGPVKSLGGENVAYGQGDYVTRLTPDQVRDRITTMRDLANGLREEGVRWVMPYICAMTINGDHEKRTGFWDFYDHWDDYRGLGLGPRPAKDPFTWLQRNPDGSPRLYYGYSGDHYPAYDAPNHRYAASWHAEGYREWMREVVRFLAKCDFDGCFVDNGTSQRGIGPLALAAFKQHLKEHFGAEKARDLLGVEEIELVEFPKNAQTPLFAEMNRFWCETIREQMAFIKKVGTEALGREFAVFPNGGNPAYLQRALPGTDFVMFEKSHGEYGTHPGLVFAPVFDEVKLRAYNDNIFEHKFVQSLRQRVKPVILSRAGYPARLPWAMLNANAAQLGMAECAAFSGGGGFLLRPDFEIYHDGLNLYRRFFETHPQLYAGLDTYATVGLLVWPEQEWFGNKAHSAAVRRITDALGEAHLLFDFVPESQTTLERLKRYDTVVAPEVRYLSDEQISVLQGYLQAGGKLLTTGQFASHDERMRERPAASLAALKAGLHCREGDELLEAIGLASSAAIVAGSPEERHVKINVFAADQRLIAHVVNYNVPLGLEALPLTEMKDFKLEIPLKPGVACSKALCYTPGEAEAVELPVHCVDGKAILRLPPLRIYQVIDLTVSQ